MKGFDEKDYVQQMYIEIGNHNYALIPVPGLYLIELFDVNQFDIAYIEYTLLSVADSMAIPDDFKLGSSLK